ncbi:MAG: glycoside hydrolase family 38 C-terminal domain-containing protein, partial [Anaerolineae bacterium]
ISGSHRARAQLRDRRRDALGKLSLPAEELKSIAGQEMLTRIESMGLRDVTFAIDGHTMWLELVQGQPVLDRSKLARAAAEMREALDREQVQDVEIVIHRGMVAECTFVAQDVPGVGYRSYRVEPVEDTASHATLEESAPIIENALLRVEAAEDGTFGLLDKRTGTTYEGLNRLVDMGDRGDEYNYCPVEDDVVVAASDVRPMVCITESGPARKTLEVTLLYRVPASLGEDRSERSDEYVDLPITTRLSLVGDLPRVEVETTVNNRAADHRLRAHFPVPFHVDAFETEGHLDVITRSPDVPQDTEGWVEQPAPTHPQRTWTDVSDGQIGLMIANRGLPEVEVLRAARGAEVALTLLRCVGWLSRGDLSVRRGPAGPELPTPEAQCIDEYTFHYAIIPHPGTWQSAIDEAHAFHAPMRAVSTGSHGGALAESGAFVRVEPASLVVSAVKQAEDGRDLIVRLWNTSPDRCEGEIQLWRSAARVSRCNLDESEIEPLELIGGRDVRFPARGNEAITLRISLDEG